MALSFKTPPWLRLPAWATGGGSVSSSRFAWLAPKYPPVAFDVDPKCLAMVRVGQRKKERFLAAFDVADLPKEMMEIDFFRAKLSRPDEFRAIAAKALSREPAKTRGVSILLPDNYARVAILPFEEMPRSRADTLDLIRYKTKKSVPFKVEESAVDYQVLPGPGPGLSVLAVLIPRAIVEEFEGIFTALGVQPGLVDLSTFGLINLYRPVLEKEGTPDSDSLIANVSGSYFTFVIFRGPQMLFYRCKSFATGLEDETGEAALKLLRRELQTSLLYYREKLQGSGIGRTYLRVVDLEPAEVAEVLTSEPEVGVVQTIDPSRVIGINGRLSGEHGERMLQRLAPAIGAAAGRSAP